MRLRRVLLLVFMLMFVLFAVVQLNDPDQAIWVVVYLAAAVLCFLAYQRKLYRWVYALAFLGYAVGAFLLWPPVYHGVIQGMEHSPAIEEARESLGLSICALVMVYCFILEWRYRA
ncbi:transmembrane 220 family protein [Rufibacter sp. XAAS-G3-1]|uniref:transmembrane 220 family protein n=1 Tax=Rufibacter sp. XAAS-G3-1 TaxID=2729134 RepID=UPI0015E71A2D|nr:transmembrane 220 family protein [Rufibacter sp. XAAS-G3-1]